MQRRHFLAGLGATALLPRVVYAGSVQDLLDDDAGWTHVSDHASGTVVYTKDVPSLGIPAFKGVYPLDVDAEALFALICDLEGHIDVSDQLLESQVMFAKGTISDFYQVMKSPGAFISQRYWLNRSTTLRDHGAPGHHKRRWDALTMDKYSKVRAVLAENYPDAVLVETTHGSWEVTPTELTYRTVSHPGGNVPAGVYATLTGKTMPDNMMNFVNHLKAG